jgi:hypothetical protein
MYMYLSLLDADKCIILYTTVFSVVRLTSMEVLGH